MNGSNLNRSLMAEKRNTPQFYTSGRVLFKYDSPHNSNYRFYGLNGRASQYWENDVTSYGPFGMNKPHITSCQAPSSGAGIINTEDHPVVFTRGNKGVEWKYDSLSRRAEETFYTNEALSSRRRFTHQGYLMATEYDASTGSNILLHTCR